MPKRIQEEYEMARKKTEEVVPTVEAVEAAEPAKKTRKPRAKKEVAAENSSR